MVYYPLQLLQRAGVAEVLLVTGQQHAGELHRPARQRPDEPRGSDERSSTSI
jgi:dTDP-glucose pyrophosphorylase